MCHDLDVDIFCVSDTFLYPSLNNSVVNINKYTLYRNDFVTYRPMYGVCCYIKTNIKVTPAKTNIPNTLTLALPDYGITICTIYKPPSNSNEENLALISLIEQLSMEGETIFVGDFNLPSINWCSDGLSTQQHGISSGDRLFANLFATLGLTQWVNEPTFLHSNNILDLVLSTESDRIINLTTHPPFHHRCGHLLIVFEYLFQSLASNVETQAPSII